MYSATGGEESRGGIHSSVVFGESESCYQQRGYTGLIYLQNLERQLVRRNVKEIKETFVSVINISAAAKLASIHTS